MTHKAIINNDINIQLKVFRKQTQSLEELKKKGREWRMQNVYTVCKAWWTFLTKEEENSYNDFVVGL